MNGSLRFILFYAVLYSSCYQANTKEKQPQRKNRFVYRETIAKGRDTGMVRLGVFKRINIADVLCQRWQLENRSIPASMIPDIEIRKSIVRDLVLFRDSSAVLNPLGKLKLGVWQIRVFENLKLLILSFSDKTQKEYIIEDISSKQLVLIMPEVRDVLLNFSAPAQTHRNIYNDPFHPVNNQWRITPLRKETDSAIHERVKNCLLFFALYYRDHIKREAATISFEGLPVIFTWYSGGIGLPDKDEISDSWVECFYNKEQALKGYSILRKLIVDYEFHWPKGAPGWIYQTHSVLEQMYHKMDDLRK